MAEEIKKEEKKVEASKIFSTVVKVILGLAFLILGLALISRWLESVLTVFKGCIGLFLILAGIITLAIAKE